MVRKLVYVIEKQTLTVLVQCVYCVEINKNINEIIN